MSTVNVTVLQANVTANSTTSNITVAQSNTVVTVSNIAVVSNSQIRQGISVSNLSGFGNLTYANDAASNGVIQYTGTSSTDIRGSISNTSPILYNSSTGVISVESTDIFSNTIANNWFTSQTTDNLTEGSSNLYFTAARSRGNISVTDSGGDGSLSYNSGTGVITYAGPTPAEARAHLSVTDAGGDGSLAYNSTSGVFTYTGPSAAEVRTHISATANINYNSSTGVISESLKTQDITEGDSLYFTAARARGNISVGTPASASSGGALAYNDTTGVFTFTPADINTLTNADVQTFIEANGLDASANITTTANTSAAHGTFTGATSLTATGNVSVGGNLNVTGNINSETVVDLFVEDRNITLQYGSVGSPSANSQIFVDRGSSANTYILWDEGTDKFKFSNDGSTDYPIPTSTSDLAEGTNLYFTAARARGNISATGNINYDNSTGVISESLTTTDITEGDNLYFTAARSRGNISVTDTGGDGSLAYDSGTGVITYTGPSASEVRTHISATANILYNSSTGVISEDLKTQDITEGDNLYFTAARSRGNISVTDTGGDGSLAYDSGTGVITYTGPSAAETRGHISVTDSGGLGSLAYDSGTGVITYTGPADLAAGKINLGSTSGTTIPVTPDSNFTTSANAFGLSNSLTDVNDITSEQPSVITAGSFVTGTKYKIRTVGSTDFTLIGAGTSTTAGSFVTGTEYTIITTGDTDFTAIGAADSNPGTIFTATGAGTGTGTAGDFARHTIFTATGAGTGTGTAIEVIDLVLKSYDNTKINTFIDNNATEGMTMVPSGRAIKSTASYRGPNASYTRTGTDVYNGIAIAGASLSSAFGRQAKIVFTAGSNVVQIYGGYNDNWAAFTESTSIANTYQNGMVLMNTSEISDYQSYTYPLSPKAHTTSLANSALSYAYQYATGFFFNAYDANVIMSEVSPVDFTWQGATLSDRGIGMYHTLANSDGDQLMFSNYLGGGYPIGGSGGGNISSYIPTDKNNFIVSDNGNVENYSSYTAGSLANVGTPLSYSDIAIGTGFPSSTAFRSTKQTTLVPTQGSAKFANIVLIGNNAQYDDTMAGHIYYPSFGINAVWDGIQDLEADTNPDFGALGAPISTGLRFKQFTDKTAQDPTSSVTGELSTAGARMLLSTANSNVTTSEATHRPITNQGIGVYGFFGSSEQEVAPRTRSLLPAGMFAVASETWVANTGTDMYFVSTPQGKKGIDTDNNEAHGFLASQNGETSLFGTSKVSFFQSGNAYSSGNIVAGFNTLKSGTEWANISASGIQTPGNITTSANVSGAFILGDGSALSNRLSGLTTADLTEGSNLYYTDARVDTRLLNGSPVLLKKFDETKVALGSVSGDQSSALNATNGSIYTLTATGDITINTIANAVAGTSMTIIITQDGTGGHALTSSMKFSEGFKVLSTGANAIDIISVFFDGTTYYASLSKGYA